MNNKYIVKLTDEEQTICEATIKEEKGKSKKLRWATILLKADADGPAWHDAKISEAVGCRTRTVENVRHTFVLEGFERALVRKKPATSPTPKLQKYEKAYDPTRPVVCMDEQPVQLIGETRVPIPATKEHPERVDYEYERKGTASIFLFAEPLSGFRQATARPRRTKDDWAEEVAHLLDTRYAGVERITRVCDNLNTHTKGAFYEAFPPGQARDYVKRIEFVYTQGTGAGSTWRSAS